MKRLLCSAAVALLFFSACKKDEERGGVTLTFVGENQSLKSAAPVVKISDFRLSFRDVEFKKDSSDLDSSEVEFRGPFSVDLMEPKEAVSQTIGVVDIPDGVYKTLRFKLHKDTDWAETDPLYDRSLYMTGTIDGTPFEFWHDASENFDIENEQGITVSENGIEVSVTFSMDMFLNSLHNIDLSQAVDTDQDGLIKINPDNDDDNGEIADLLKENIKEAADLIKL